MARWGNALGGYKRQPRNAKGQFGSKGGSAKSVAKKASPKKTSAKKVAKKKPQTNASVQNRHRKTIAAVAIGSRAGGVVGRVAGASAGASLGGPGGALIGSYVGSSIGSVYGVAAGSQVSMRKGWAIGASEYKKLSAADKAAIQKRNKRYAQAELAITVASLARTGHNVAKQSGAYDGLAETVRGARETRGQRIRTKNMGNGTEQVFTRSQYSNLRNLRPDKSRFRRPTRTARSGASTWAPGQPAIGWNG